MIGDGSTMRRHRLPARVNGAGIGCRCRSERRRTAFCARACWRVPQAVTIARNAKRLVRENLAIAVGYNAIAMPPPSWYVTPPIAAVAMSCRQLISLPMHCAFVAIVGEGNGKMIRGQAIFPRHNLCWRVENDGLFLSYSSGVGLGCGGTYRLFMVAQERSVRRSGRRGGAYLV
jgi:hypothetical protein